MIDSVIQVERIVRDFWASAPSNSLHLETGEKAWAMPHVAIAQGDDPLFLRNKDMIGPFLWTPEEAYALDNHSFCHQNLRHWSHTVRTMSGQNPLRGSGATCLA